MLKDRNIFKIKCSLFFLIVVAYLLLASGLPWIEADYQLTRARNLVTYHTLSSEGKLYDIDVISRDNRGYDSHGITNILLMVPVACSEKLFDKYDDKNADYLLSFLGALTGIVVNSLTCLVFFSILSLLGRPLRVCFYTTLCLAFLTLVFPYSSTNYEGNLNMLFMLSALYFMFSFLKANKSHYLIFSGVFSGLAVNTRDFALIFLFCIIMFVFILTLKQKNFRISILFLFGLFPLLIFWGYYNWLRTSHFYLSPIASGVISGRWSQLAPTQNIMFGLRGLLLSKGGSIFAYSPILLLSLFGWKDFFKERKKECVFILSIIILFLLANSKLPEWYGLCCWGPRYTLDITPLMMLPMGYWFSVDGMQNKIKKSFFIIISIYSLLIQLGATLTHWHARLGYVLYNKGRYAFIFTAQYSQWWDSVRTLFINLWNLVFGSFLYLNNPGYCPTTSEASLYAAKRLFTWWYRLIFMGVNPFLIASYVILSIVAIYILIRYIMRNELFKLKIEASKW